MNTHDIDRLKNELLSNKIELSDTISQFMEKCNNNFSAIIEWGGGPSGEKGENGEPGVPTKPKVPIHIWRENFEYDTEIPTSNGGFELYTHTEDLSNPKYQEGHLIMLNNAHVYILEVSDNFNLKPKYMLTLQSYDPDSIVDGKNAYVHIAYANSLEGDGFITDQELRGETVDVESAMTYNLRGNSNNDIINTSSKPYMGVYSDNNQTSSKNPNTYTWIKVQGKDGADGIKGDKGDKGDPGEQGPKGDRGDGYTGQPYTIDLEGDMSTISIDIDRTRLYDDSGDYCMCKLHAYYGDKNVSLNVSDVMVDLPDDYMYSDNDNINIILSSNQNNKVGKIEKTQSGNDVIIKFIPDISFIFPTKPIIFTLHVESEIIDDDETVYNFTRDTVWMVKGVISEFKLEIIPQHRTIKLSEDGIYNPEKLLVDVYKNEDGKRTSFDFNQYNSFTLLYKNYNDNDWIEYPNEGVNTSGVSCFEFKVVRYLGTLDEETWDYEDVWVVADGKSAHYYHADLGAMESMMVLTTGERINIAENSNDPIYCAKLRDESGYSITFEPKLYDGETELTVESITIGSNSGEEYYINGSFERKIEGYTLTITKVPYDVEMIPMSIIISGKDVYGVTKQDTISFNVYISNLSNIYTLSPTVSVYNTSTGQDGDMIGCNVYKNNNLVETDELDTYALKLEYIICGEQGNTNKKKYTKPIVYGYDTSGNNDDFTASDVAIEFILSYRDKEVVMSTVPLIKDGQNGKDGQDGQPGKDGENGKDGALYKTIMIYTSTEDDTKPDTPNGGSYNFIDGKFEIDDEKWSNLTDNLEGIIWSSSKTFCNDATYPEDSWTTPIRITGDKGEAGKDGSDIQFIYYLIDSEENKPGKPDNTQTNENPTGGWTSSPTGVDINKQYEYMSMRTKVNDKWSDWSVPALWSKYGVNGQDGDGVEYIYYLETTNNDGTEISKPTYDNSDNKEWHDMSSLYQQKEWIPEGWEDSPTGVSLDHHYEWVSIRKFRYDDTYKRRMWSEFSTPTIWAKFGMNGEKGAPGDGAISKIVMLYATFNETTDITKPLDNIKWDFSQNKVINLESNDVWKTSDNNLTPPVYMSSRIFSDNESLIDETWSYPVKISGKDGEKGVDGDGIEFMYLTNTTIDIPEDKNPKDDDTKELLEEKGWTDNPTGVKEECKFEFMTMRTSIGGVWGNWCEPALWSKYGDTGQDGDGVEYVYTTTNSENDIPTISTPDNWSEVDSDYQKSEFKPTNDEGESIWSDNPSGVKDEDSCRVEWVSSRKYCVSQNDDVKKWQKFSEPKVWSRFSKDGEDGKDGKDGNSWQYIFCVSPKYPFSETGFSNPSEWTDDKPKDSNNELLGDNGQKDPNWFDEHKDVDAVNKFQYQAYRKWDRDNGCWGKYGNPTLYSNYSESGSGYSVMLSNPIAVIPVGDDDWSTNENASNQTDSTFVYFYNNTSDMSTSENLTISLPQYNPYVSRGIFTTTIENNVNKVVFKPVVGNYIFNFGSNTQYKLPITLTYDLGNSDGDKFTTTINWTLSPIKGLSDVEVYVDKRIVNISENTTQSIKVGYYLKSSDGTKTFVENKTSNNKGYKIFLTDDIDELTNEVNDWTNAVYTFVYDDGSNKNCYVVLTDSIGNKLDYVNVTSIKDGQDGINGQDGISTFISTIFKISKKTPDKPVGGTYADPVADSTDWFESIPERNNNNHTYPLWSSSKRFASDGSLDKDDWTTPIQMSDTFDFEVIYSNNENPNSPTIDDFSKSRNGTINKTWCNNNPQWSDDGNVDSIWMATTKMNNGIWSDWVISKIKGEQGPQGIQGEQGETGKLGKVTYPAGLYNENKLYILDDVKTPYVICSDDKYYMLKSVPDNKKYWAENRKYYNSTHNTSSGKDVYKYISVAPDDYNDSTKTSITNYTQVIGCNNDNFNTKWYEKKPPLDIVKQHLTGTYKYIGQSYKYGNTTQIVGNVIWTLNPDKTEVILASKFLYSKDGTPENIIDNINDVYFSGKSPIDDENWEIFESFEAIHAKIGIIDNGTIGSAVYSGDYMFSQQGVDSNENTSTSYHNFNPSHIYDSESTFKPNICMNFKTGEMNACCGNVKFGNNSLYVKNFLKKMRTTIDDDNLDNYTETRYFLDEDGNPDNSLPYKVLNIEKTGSFIEWNCSTPETLYLFSLPQLFPGKYGNGIVWEEIDAVRDYIGNEIYIKVNKGSFGIVCYKRINNATNITEKSIMLFEGESAVLTCKSGLITDNNISYECIYWDIIFGKQFEFYYVNHPWEP